MTDKTIVIVGAGLAGAKAAETLREEGFDGRLLLVGAETAPPYHRPPLSKGHLTGDGPRNAAPVLAEGFLREHDVELEVGRVVTALDLHARTVVLHGGRAVRFDRLLIATGAVPRTPPIPGTALEGVHVLRTLADADALRERLAGGAALAVIGAGWIGCEVAAAARARGCEVTLIEAAATPLEGVLGPQLGGYFAGVHRGHGVRLATGARVERIEGRDRVEGVRLAGGTRVPCDTVLLAVGVAPATRLAEAAGLQVDDGIVVDERLRTAHPDVFAAGDVASAWRPRYGRRVRVEHWANAREQGPAAARSMLGRGEPFDALPAFFSVQHDVRMDYVGLHSPSDRLVVRGRPEDGRLHALWLDGAGCPTAGLSVNDREAIEPIERLVGAGLPVDASRLADDSAPLELAYETATESSVR